MASISNIRLNNVQELRVGTAIGGAICIPVAVKVSGEPVRPPAVAAKVLVPAVVPSVQLPTVAIPLASVIATDRKKVCPKTSNPCRTP